MAEAEVEPEAEAESAPGQSTDDESLKDIYDAGMKLFNIVENGNEPTKSANVQMYVRKAIAKFEQVTNLVSISGMFSKNENINELPTDTLQYLLLPALLGTLSLKLYGRPRMDLIKVAEIYFRDFLQRCKDYEVTDVDLPKPEENVRPERTQNEAEKIQSLVLTRDAKIKRYQEAKELKQKLGTLSEAMSSPTVDDETKREYFTTLLMSYVNQSLDELASIEQEKPLLEYMTKHAGEAKPPKYSAPPLKPVIITRDEVQKAVYGLGYPSLPSVTIEEFYDKRVREGLFPGPCGSPTVVDIQNPDTIQNKDDEEEASKEQLIDDDDPEELNKQRQMDEYKDDHRRGWGNRHNRS